MSRQEGRNLPDRRGVCDDWIRALPRDKNRVFDAVVGRWERAYAMMSVALDDAMTLRARGELVCAHQQVGVAVDLLRGLANALVGCCETLIRRGRRLDEIPSVEPMRTEFFRGQAAKSAASRNGFLHRVLFGERSRFTHKLRILSETLAEIEGQFTNLSDELSRGVSVRAGAWRTLDCLHYDFNTCLRESEVVLKSFLRVLPSDQLEFFAAEMETPFSPKRAGGLPGVSPRPAST